MGEAGCTGIDDPNELITKPLAEIDLSRPRVVKKLIRIEISTS